MTNILRIHKLNTAELISLETQCNDSTFVDKLFKSVFKSWRFENHASQCYFKITTINYIIIFLLLLIKNIIEIGHELTSR